MFASAVGTRFVTAIRVDQNRWVSRFHEGHRPVIEECYREHFTTVERAVGRVLAGADKETVIHEVFCALLSERRVRESFRGGAFAAWIGTLARNRAIDFVRRHRRELAVEPERVERMAAREDRQAERAEARMMVNQFRARVLPEKWAPVFEARFIEQLSQREAAAKLGLRRTTLAYQEDKVRALLRRFLLRSEVSA